MDFRLISRCPKIGRGPQLRSIFIGFSVKPPRVSLEISTKKAKKISGASLGPARAHQQGHQNVHHSEHLPTAAMKPATDPPGAMLIPPEKSASELTMRMYSSLVAERCAIRGVNHTSAAVFLQLVACLGCTVVFGTSRL